MRSIPKSAFSQFLIVAFAAGFALAYEIPAEVFSFGLWLEEAIISFMVVLLLMVLTYLFQVKLAFKRGASIKYDFWPWGLIATVFLSLLSSGKFPYFMPGYFEYETSTARLGHKKPMVGRADAAVLAGVGPTIALIIGLLFLQNRIVADAAIAFAAWSMLSIPFSNGFYYFNWHPVSGGIMSVLGIFLFVTHVMQLQVIGFIVLIFFLPYQWLYVYVIAKRHSY